MILDTDSLIAAACAAADVAGAVIRPFFRAGMVTDQKADRSPVTIADRTAEQTMRAVLTERFPDHGVLGEEFGLDRPEAALRWVLDPIDGTRAFITGRPTFGTLIALFQDDKGAPAYENFEIPSLLFVGLALFLLYKLAFRKSDPARPHGPTV